MTSKMDILGKHWPPLRPALAHLLLPRAWVEGTVSSRCLSPTQKLLFSKTAMKDVFLTVTPSPSPAHPHAPGPQAGPARQPAPTPVSQRFPRLWAQLGGCDAEASPQSPQGVVLPAFVVFPPSVEVILVLRQLSEVYPIGMFDR